MTDGASSKRRFMMEFLLFYRGYREERGGRVEGRGGRRGRGGSGRGEERKGAGKRDGEKSTGRSYGVFSFDFSCFSLSLHTVLHVVMLSLFHGCHGCLDGSVSSF